MFRRIMMAAACMFAGIMAMAVVSMPAMAGLGQPVDGQIGLQLPATTVMDDLTSVYDIVNHIIIVVALFVMLLLIYVMFRFRESANPTPSRTTHNTLLEVAWTIIPILILVGISIPSFRLLYYQYSFPKPDVTIKATGNSWFWDHEYIDQKFTVTSNMVSDEDIIKTKIGEEAYAKKYGPLNGAALHTALYNDSLPLWAESKEVRRLAVDMEIAVPVNKVVHMLVTSNDVIHQWTIPSFGVKQQAVPGRTAAVWFKPEKTGIYYGQCSVLCGKLHSAMPIAVRVVEQPVYDSWVAAMQAKDRKKAQEILKAEADRMGATNAVAAAN